MKLIQIVLFFLLFATVAFFAYKKYSRIWKNIQRGRPLEAVDNVAQRLKNVVFLALGQKKMFQNWIPAVLHLFIYLAFVITQIELIEIFIDGAIGAHRVFAATLGGLYTFIISFIEVLSLLALIATFIFLARRNLLKVPRFHKAEMTGWPTLDGNLILYGEIWLVSCIFLMNGTDTVLQTMDPAHFPSTGFLAVSGWLGPALFGGLSESVLKVLERVGWWGHLVGVLGFILYLPHSKHLHIMLAFPNTYFADLEPMGKMRHMQSITDEIKLMMDPSAEPPAEETEEIPSFGAADVEDLSQLQLLSAYSCTECGRCTDACPANQTGKLLSPRKIMMDVRDRMEEKFDNELEHGADHDDGKKLIDDYITKEEIYACTSCNACVQECPISINPLSIILELRRNKIMEQADSSEEWNLMFTNTENNQAVWQFPPSDRDKWTKDL
ncbi:(Fe-S)-binding protein [Chitinophagales bacterium]|nr:(Fe-S)-binding protein [Chitinophagales bacterium]